MKACPFCAEDIQDAAIVCKHCHKDLTARTVAVIDEPVPPGAFDATHYERAFAKFDQAGGSFAPTWNWGACLFSVLWYFYRRMWAKGALLLLIAVVTGGMAAPLFWIYAGIAGNYDYYLLKRKHTQLWR